MERRNDREVYVRRGSSDAEELIPSTTGHCGQPCIERGCAFQSKKVVHCGFHGFHIILPSFKKAQLHRKASQTACCNGTDSSEGTSLPSRDQNVEAEGRSELKTSSAGIHLSSIEGRTSIRLFVTERLLISTDVEDVLELPDERYESERSEWSQRFNLSRSPLMGQFWKMEAVWMLPSTEETKSEPVLLRFEQFVMVGNDNPSLLRCPEKKREYADVVQLYLHQYWAEVVHDAPYCAAVRSKEGQMPLGV
ncbi:hypothetical protein T4E_5931 [Trichinella pseudospiralis]|uniref:Uncharacterized protein n=2 Tax=Trichinella pseudospiralis TaxID=6337 RepID=A0A0V0Y1F4_TRIPS|nr:hypothetical protein T4E_5931 [Trichinella pseudospiralis]